jgi:hypothetical protein
LKAAEHPCAHSTQRLVPDLHEEKIHCTPHLFAYVRKRRPMSQF